MSILLCALAFISPLNLFLCFNYNYIFIYGLSEDIQITLGNNGILKLLISIKKIEQTVFGSKFHFFLSHFIDILL